MAKVGISRKFILASKYRSKRKAIRSRMGYTRTRLGAKMPNKFVFKRAGQEQTIQNTSATTVAFTNTGVTGWALTGVSADANTLFQFGGAFQAQLDQVQAYTDFVSMFDKYKISGVKVRFIPLVNSSNPGQCVPMIAYAIDTDDASTPASYAELNQKYNVHKKRLDRPCSIYIKPRVAASVYNGLSSGYAIGKPMYIDCNNVGVPHYGLKFWLRDVTLGATTSVNTVVRIETTYYLSMKDPQ